MQDAFAALNQNLFFNYIPIRVARKKMPALPPPKPADGWRLRLSDLRDFQRSPLWAAAITAAICIAATLLSSRFIDKELELQTTAVADRILRLAEANFGGYETYLRLAAQVASPASGDPLAGGRGYMIADTLGKQFPAARYVAFIGRAPKAAASSSATGSAAYVLRSVLPAPEASKAAARLGGKLAFAAELGAATRERAAIFVPANTGLAYDDDHLPFLLVPVFSPLPGPGAGDIAGFMAMGIDVGKLMNKALELDVPRNWGVRLTLSAPRAHLPSSGDLELFSRQGPPAARSAAADNTPIRRQFRFADGSLTLEISPSAEPNVGVAIYVPWLIFTAGLFASIMLFLLIRVSQKSHKTAELLAESRSNEVLEQRRRFRDLVESSNDWIWELDADFHFRYVSPTTQTLLGYVPEQLLGRHISEIGHYEGAETGNPPLFPFHSDRPVAYANFERMMRHANGRRLVFESAGTPILDAEGNFTGLRGTDRDMTRQHQLRDLHSALQQELATHMQQQLVNQLLSGLAHELNQPLATIASYNQACLRMLRQNDVNWPEINHAMQASAENALLAGEIIARVRRLAMQQAPDLVPLNVATLIFNTLRFADDQLKLNAVVVGVSMAAPLPQALGDPIFVTQALLNLLYNAVQAMSSNPAESRSISIEAGMKSSAEIFVTVRDTGCGVSASLAERIFEPQFTTKANGMGLGLTISRSIIEVLNGELTYAPNPGGGSAFTITLPMAET
jgi:PAS domain S-box-containing protein